MSTSSRYMLHAVHQLALIRIDAVEMPETVHGTWKLVYSQLSLHQVVELLSNSTVDVGMNQGDVRPDHLRAARKGHSVEPPFYVPA